MLHALNLIRRSSHARLVYPTRNEVEEVNKAVAMGFKTECIMRIGAHRYGNLSDDQYICYKITDSNTDTNIQFYEI